MPISTLDPQSALIVIDLQNAISKLQCAHPLAEVIGQARDLATAFRQNGLPVILVAATGSPPGRTERAVSNAVYPPENSKILAEFGPQPSDHLVSKRTMGAFTGSDLIAYLSARGITQVVVCGVATSLGVESTARQAHELGFHVTLAIDAMTDFSIEAHENSLQRVFPRIGETGNASEIVAMLSRVESINAAAASAD
jgi:nicotinamidase-related amidase